MPSIIFDRSWRRSGHRLRPLDVYVGARLRARRLGLRISQTKLGEVIGVTFQQVQKYENGFNRIGAGNLLRFSNALGVEVAYFYEDVDPNIKLDMAAIAAIPSNDPMLSKDCVRLARDFIRIKDEDVRKNFAQLVRVLARVDAG